MSLKAAREALMTANPRSQQFKTARKIIEERKSLLQNKSKVKSRHKINLFFKTKRFLYDVF